LTIAAALGILKDVVNQAADLDRVFQALSDPSRRLIVERLVKGPASVSELAQPLAMSLPGAMQHLQVLEACALVASEKSGRVRTCRVNTEVLRQAERWIHGQRTAWERRLDRLGDHLGEEPEEGS
jgi:DNA-binding transcriptional ArsR family regulator